MISDIYAAHSKRGENIFVNCSPAILEGLYFVACYVVVRKVSGQVLQIGGLYFFA